MSYPCWKEISSHLKEVDGHKALFSRSPASAESVEFLRHAVQKELEKLEQSLQQLLDKKTVSLALFALVSLLDEEIARFLWLHSNLAWSPLQRDFFGSYSAGELFYKNIDDILDEAEVPIIILEAFYFALARGFQGKYRDSKIHITRYQGLLKEKISSLAGLKAENSQEKRAEDLELKKGLGKWRYYAAAFALVIGTYLSLYIISSL